jgi:hypothetical protein
VASWLTVELYGRLHSAEEPLERSPVSAAQLGSVVDAIESGGLTSALSFKPLDFRLRCCTVSSLSSDCVAVAPAAKTVFQRMFDGDSRLAIDIAAAEVRSRPVLVAWHHHPRRTREC